MPYIARSATADEAEAREQVKEPNNWYLLPHIDGYQIDLLYINSAEIVNGSRMLQIRAVREKEKGTKQDLGDPVRHFL